MNKEEQLHTSIAPLLIYFNNLMLLNSEEIKLVTDLFKPRLYRKRQYILQEGDVCNQFNFVVRGCLRMYKIDDKGATHIIQFAAENWWLMDIGSFHQRSASELNIDALEDTMVLQISYDNLISLYLQSPKFDRDNRRYIILQSIPCILRNATTRFINFTLWYRVYIMIILKVFAYGR